MVRRAGALSAPPLAGTVVSYIEAMAAVRAPATVRRYVSSIVAVVTGLFAGRRWLGAMETGVNNLLKTYRHQGSCSCPSFKPARMLARPRLVGPYLAPYAAGHSR